MQSNSNNTNITNYTWNGVVEFLQDQVKNMTIKQNEYLLEKQQFTVIKIMICHSISFFIFNRARLINLKVKYAKANPNNSKILVDADSKLNQDIQALNLNVNANNIQIPSIPRRRAKSNRPLLLK